MKDPVPSRAFLAIAAAGLSALVAAQTPPSPSARVLAGNCANCHGTTGRAAGAMPALAGMNRAHFIEQMRLFRDGRRSATVMHQLARGYRDDEVAALAEHFERQSR